MDLQQVFIQRRRLIPDDKVYPESDHTITAAERAKYSASNNNWFIMTPPDTFTLQKSGRK
jgi:hypothetical protein